MMSVWSLSIFIIGSFYWKLLIINLIYHDIPIKVDHTYSDLEFKWLVLIQFKVELVFGLQDHTDNTIKLYSASSSRTTDINKSNRNRKKGKKEKKKKK